MARPLRLEFAGALYHVTTRGNERRSIFLGDAEEGLTVRSHIEHPAGFVYGVL